MDNRSCVLAANVAMQVQQLLREVEHMQERHMQLQQQQQPPASLGDSNSGSSLAALEQAAVLLCGDFNTTPDSDTVRVSRWMVAVGGALC